MKNVIKLETLDDLLNEHIKTTKTIFKKDGDVVAMVIGYAASKRYFFPLMFYNNEEKLKILDMVKIYFAIEKVTRYTVSFEGWMLRASKNNMEEYNELKEKGLRIEDSPNRVEILSCIAVSYNDNKSIMYEILEDRTLKDINLDKADFSGLFSELLPPQNLSEFQREKAHMILELIKTYFKDTLIIEDLDK